LLARWKECQTACVDHPGPSGVVSPTA
jgi:hypothetical protein